MAKRLLFFGSDLVSFKVLGNLSKSKVARITVVCPPLKKPRTPLATLHQLIKQQSLAVVHEFQSKPSDWHEIDEYLKRQPYDIGVVASFGHMIPDYIIDRFSMGMMVVHPSLLPKYRGSCPI